MPYQKVTAKVAVAAQANRLGLKGRVFVANAGMVPGFGVGADNVEMVF